MTKNEFNTRIAELIAKGYSNRAAERTARKERWLTHPAHLAARARRAGLAAETRRYDAEHGFASVVFLSK